MLSLFFLSYFFHIYTPTHTRFLSEGISAVQLAPDERNPDVIAALCAAGAHEEEPEVGEDSDLDQDGESDEDD
jgi:hypothetical protein